MRLAVFFAGLIILGLLIHTDYGISWDEPQSRLTGLVNAKHLSQTLFPFSSTAHLNVSDLQSFRDKDYGVAFELPVVALEQVLGLQDSRQIYEFRHLMTFLFFLLGAYALVNLIERRWQSWQWGLVGAGLLILSPRFFAEAFYNSKDIVFMSAFVIALATMAAFLQTPTRKTLLLHAFATAFAMNIRIMAVVILATTAAALLVHVFRGGTPLRKAAAYGAGYALLSYGFFVLLFPYIWDKPISGFFEVFTNMASFRWPYDVLYQGEFINARDLPWHYAFTWIGITTPILYLGLFAIGLIQLARNDRQLLDLILLGILVATFGAVIYFQSVLYDGWRHLYFLYPIMLYFGVAALRLLAPFSWALIAAHSVFIAIWMWQAHPLQNVYFNAFAGDEPRYRWEMDYWGLANHDALMHIAKSDDRPQISVYAASNTPLLITKRMLPPQQRGRFLLQQEPAPKPDYVLSNYRGVERGHLDRFNDEYVLFHEVKVGGHIILTILQRKPHSNAASTPSPMASSRKYTAAGG